VTPVQISRVAATWRAAGRHRLDLKTAIASSLPDGTRHVDAKAEWIMQTVDRLVPLLTSPTQLCIAAQEMVERRGTMTTADLVASRDALLAGLDHVLGPPSEQTLVAWHQACGLFADVISALAVNPFCN
jgi:hypothetical protein